MQPVTFQLTLTITLPSNRLHDPPTCISSSPTQPRTASISTPTSTNILSTVEPTLYDDDVSMQSPLTLPIYFRGASLLPLSIPTGESQELSQDLEMTSPPPLELHQTLPSSQNCDAEPEKCPPTGSVRVPFEPQASVTSIKRRSQHPIGSGSQANAPRRFGARHWRPYPPPLEFRVRAARRI